MLAQTYGRDTVVSAQTVTLSTLLSILTLPSLPRWPDADRDLTALPIL
jgi:riboflavin transporter FmnP